MKRLALGAALLALAALPFWVGNTFYVNIATQILLYAVFALGINVLVGYAGLVTLGHAGLFGVAAYTGARILDGGHGQPLHAAGRPNRPWGRSTRTISIGRNSTT